MERGTYFYDIEELNEKQVILLKQTGKRIELFHSNILDLSQDNSVPYPSKYIPLRSLIEKEGILPPHHSIDIMTQILDAISALHENNIIYKYVSPDHILVEKKISPNVKNPVSYKAVLLPWIFDTLSIPQEQYFFAAPEALKGGRVDTRSDIFSAGATLYYLLTGQDHAVLELPSELNPVVSSLLDKIVKKALSVDKERRFISTSLFKHELIKARTAIDLQLEKIKTETRRLIGKSRAPLLKLIAFALSLVVLFTTIYFIYPLLMPKPKVNGSQTKTVKILTDPPNAEIFLNGNFIGHSPVDVNVSDAIVDVKATLRFYIDKNLRLIRRNEQVLVIDKSQDGREEILTSNKINLGLQRQKGLIRILTPNVDSVTVYIGKNIAGNTPFESEQFANVYEITLKKEGFKTKKLPLTLLGGMTFLSEVTLVPEDKPDPPPQKATLHVKTSPSGAEVFVNDKLEGISPLELSLEPGDYKVKLIAKYYQPMEERLSLSSGKNIITCPLTKITGTLKVISEPAGANVFINGNNEGTTPLEKKLEGGTYKVTLSMDSFEDKAIDVDIADSQPKEVNIKLVKLPVTKVIIDAPMKLNVYIDGKFAGKTLLSTEIVPGKHDLIVGGILKTIKVPAAKPDSDPFKIHFSLPDLEMTEVEKGDFFYGAKKPNFGEIELVKKTLFAYYIDLYEVTNKKYKLFLDYVNKTGDHSMRHPDQPKDKDHTPKAWIKDYELPKYWKPEFNKPEYPVVGIDFYDAYAYAAWTGKTLPSEEEWEKAARGKNGNVYPWGNIWNGKLLNHGEKKDRDHQDPYDYLAPVGKFTDGKSPYGAHDMSGNVMEWCINLYVRGGSFIDGDAFVTTYSRSHQSKESFAFNLGFRCAWSLK